VEVSGRLRKVTEVSETANFICRIFASEIGNPTEILDTPKEILIIPRVFPNTPKENLVLTIKTFKKLWHWN
jgi:hypothetical protein